MTSLKLFFPSGQNSLETVNGMACTENIFRVSLATHLVNCMESKGDENEELSRLCSNIRRSLLMHTQSFKELAPCRSYFNEGIEFLLLAAKTPKEEDGTMSVLSKERLISAQDCFEASSKEALAAFDNESLSIKNRIVACELIVSAKIVESGLEDPKAANIFCLSFVKRLHELPEIREMFSVSINGGWKSMFRKADRLQNIKSVQQINHDLYDFSSHFELSNSLEWPVITLKDRSYPPIDQAEEILRKTSGVKQKMRHFNNNFL